MPLQAAPDAASKAVDAFVATPALTPASAAEAKASCDSYLDRAAALQAALDRTAPRLFGRRPQVVAVEAPGTPQVLAVVGRHTVGVDVDDLIW